MRFGERQFDQLDVAPPPENTESVSRYTEAIRSVVGTDREVRLMYPERIGRNEHRYEYGFTRDKKGVESDGFAKTVRLKENATQAARLQRESRVTAIANVLDMPTPRLLQPYTETDNDLAIVHIEALDGRYGEALPGTRMTASAPPEYGRWAAKLLANATGTEIPKELGPERIETYDERSANPEKFWKIWDGDYAKTIDLPPESQAILTPAEVDQLREILAAVRQELEPGIQAAENPDRWWFVHNDASPGNTFFDREQKSSKLIDMEYSGATHNEALACITDWGNFYARCWPNPEMQQNFIKTLVDATDARIDKQKAIWIRGAMAFTTIYLAKFAMNPEHPEHDMAKALLRTLPERLQQLDSLLHPDQEG